MYAGPVSDCDCGVMQAVKPAQPIEKGLAGAGLLAHVITSKYCDHQPLHRQERIIARHGVRLSRNTLCDWIAAKRADLKAPRRCDAHRGVAVQSDSYRRHTGARPRQEEKPNNAQGLSVAVPRRRRPSLHCVRLHAHTKQRRARNIPRIISRNTNASALYPMRRLSRTQRTLRRQDQRPRARQPSATHHRQVV